ncbi:hypothetical protein MNEG_5560 [Monoraphidium neglectum]|uniref:Uncharacterized protein n=1 Tax=Monoraphidium neglectum TaxID=145388 RepID=A0A0D2MH37_9CHLO|nr:hypothetical protein MNEG_5560 [Monoraphidium neglectum]KIZ02395.1 hypothetical protein MNEG_5560 [Monoraphidium neglectum]|eukprot:XP_013901414.1 hypothetical protein MNEG_5560 [Monoraphidium neglectum]
MDSVEVRHFAGRGFERLRCLALHVVRPGADTCVAAQVPQAADAGAAPPSPPPGRAGVSSADAAADGAGATPPQDPRAPSALHSQLHAAIQDMLLQELEPQQQEQQQERQLLLSQLLDQLASQAAPQLEPHQPRMQVAAAPTVARVGLLVALCPALRQLSIGCGGPQVLRAIEGHATLHHIEMHGGAALPTHAPPSPHAIGGCEAAGAATAAFTAVLPPHGSAGAWEPLRRAPPALTRLALLDADALLGGAASPIAPLVALANGAAHLAVARGGGGGDGGSGGGVSELHLMRYSSLTDGGLAAAAPLMAGVRALVLDGCQNLTDAGLIWVAALPLLESLILSRCPLITDAGLARALAAAPALRRASLAGCGGTTAGGAAAAAGTAGAARGRRVEIDWARA